MHRRVVRVHRRGEARVDDGSRPRDDLGHAEDAVVDGQRRIDERHEAVRARRTDERRAHVRRPARLVVRAREVEADAIAPLAHAHAKTDRRPQVHAIVVDEALGLRRAVGPRGDRRAQLRLGPVHEAAESGAHRLVSVLRDRLAQPPLAETARADLAVQVADDNVRRAAVRGEDPVELADAESATLVEHRWEVHALVERLERLPRAAARDGAADVALVRHARAEPGELAVREDRRDHRHVRRVRHAALVRMVHDERVALPQCRRRVACEGPRDRGGERAHVEREDDVLRREPTAGIE